MVQQTKPVTPPKFNMEPKKWEFGRCFSFSNGWFSGSMLVFWGVTQFTKSHDLLEIPVIPFQNKSFPRYVNSRQCVMPCPRCLAPIDMNRYRTSPKNWLVTLLRNDHITHLGKRKNHRLKSTFARGYVTDTVDGQNPAPSGMVKPL